MTPAASQPTVLWYVSRGSGFVALLLLAVVLGLGLLSASRWRPATWPRALSVGLHRSLTWLLLATVALHVVTASLDSFASIHLADAVAPFLTRYRPLWMALGTLSVDLGILVVLTTLARRALGPRAWRAVHRAGWLCAPLAVLHALGTGTDAPSLWGFVLILGALALVAGTAAARLLAGERRSAAQMAGAAAVVVGGMAVLVWAQAGPLQSGWARSAGTPAELLPAGPGAPLAQVLPPGTDDALSGNLQDLPGGSAELTLTDRRDPSVTLVLDTTPGSPSGSLEVLHGALLGCKAGAAIASEVQGSCGNLALTLRVSSAGGAAVTGELRVAAGPAQ